MSKTTRALAAAALGAAALTAASAAPASALPLLPSLAVPQPTTASQRTCTQAPEQTFAEYGDQRGYVLVPGGDMADRTGWQLSQGASYVKAPQRRGDAGVVLSLAPGATVTTPLFCVDLRYASARAFTRVAGGTGVPQLDVGVLTPAGNLLGGGAFGARLPSGSSWAPTDDINADPRIAGTLGQYRSVAFQVRNTGKATIQLDDVSLDPRMR